MLCVSIGVAVGWSGLSGSSYAVFDADGRYFFPLTSNSQSF